MDRSPRLKSLGFADRIPAWFQISCSKTANDLLPGFERTGQTFVEEPGSREVSQGVRSAHLVGTVAISRAEVVATFGKAFRIGILSREEVQSARHQFNVEWRHYWHVRVSDSLIEHAADLSWTHRLRGYDSVQLAAAMAWQESLGAPVSLITFDIRLWEASGRAGLEPYPHDLPKLRESWKAALA